ncbi:MAG: agmatinase [Candidatus Margulisiibacteriota bacterium]|nr:agmatinase [Candidatus Margulisiibacteriota bacterium]
MSSRQFLDLGSQYRDYQNAKFVVIPVPYEKTTTYGKGARNGPSAILTASQKLETFDEDLKLEPYKKAGIHTTRPIHISHISSHVSRILNDNKIPVVFGGEHSISPYAVKACAEKYKDLSVLQFDAHADLRDSYQGSRENHACPMRRILEICPAVQVGIRSISKEEHAFAEESGQIKKIHWAKKIELAEKIENQLSKDVYITIDVDVFDPGLIPATGTPEPGGMFWYEVIDILSRVCRDKNVVGFDVVELAPIKGRHAPDFTIAKLVYKMMGYISSKS